MLGRTVLAVAILIWTALTWGGRVRLLAEGEPDLSNWLRIGGSLLIGPAAAVVLWLAPQGQVERLILTLFAVWSSVIWIRSLVTVWTGDNSIGFKVVHTVLAAGFFALSYWSAWLAWSPRR